MPLEHPLTRLRVVDPNLGTSENCVEGSYLQQNYSRFGGYLAKAVVDEEADFDKDGQTSLLEAFLAASAAVAEFYKQGARLATENALLDDNGDGLATPASWFRGVRAVKHPKEGTALDDSRAHQFHLLRSEFEKEMPADVRARRGALELRVSRLRERKGELEEQDYYSRLEGVFLELARLYEKLEARGSATTLPEPKDAGAGK